MVSYAIEVSKFENLHKRKICNKNDGGSGRT